MGIIGAERMSGLAGCTQGMGRPVYLGLLVMPVGFPFDIFRNGQHDIRKCSREIYDRCCVPDEESRTTRHRNRSGIVPGANDSEYRACQVDCCCLRLHMRGRKHLNVFRDTSCISGLIHKDTAGFFQPMQELGR